MSAIEQRAREILAAERKKDLSGCAIRAIVAALTPPEGYVLVPVDPTEAMRNAGLEAGDGHDWEGPETVWAAMIFARPEAK